MFDRFRSRAGDPVAKSIAWDHKRRRRHAVMLEMEALEHRRLLATRFWVGGGSDSYWMTAENWQGNVAPEPNDDLVFPEDADNFLTYNDFTNSTIFNSITIEYPGYTIEGSVIGLNGSITTTYEFGSSSIEAPLNLQAPLTFDIATGGDLIATAPISGVANTDLTKIGGGSLRLAPSVSNSYSGSTFVNEGELILAATDGAQPVRGTLYIGDNAGGSATLTQAGNNQIPDSTDVFVREDGTYNLGTYQETFDTLTLQGSTVSIGAGGVLTIGLTIMSSTTTNGVTALIEGPGALDLGGKDSFPIVVNDDLATLVDMRIGAVIQNGGMNKLGTGWLALSGANTYKGQTAVLAGALQVENSAALGTTDGATTVANGASVFFSGSGLSIAEDFSINGVGDATSGAIATSSGNATLTGAVTLNGNSQVGASESSALIINGVIDDGVNSFDLSIFSHSFGLVTLGGSNTFGGNVSVHSGILRVDNDNALGDPSTSTNVNVNSGSSLDLSGGITLPDTRSIVLEGNTAPDVSKINNISGDNTIAGDISITGDNNVSFAVGGGDTLTISGAISGLKDFDKNGPGTLVLSGSSTHSGNVSVYDGHLLVNGSIATSNMVNVEGRLGGSGTLPAVFVTSIGTLAPGNSPGILSSGDTTFASGAKFEVELNGTTVGTQYDQLNVNGTVDLGGATLVVSLGFTPTPGDAFTIINNDDDDAIDGTFAGLAEGATLILGAHEFTITYEGGTADNDVVLTYVGLATFTWDGGGSDNNWTTAANWVGDVAPSEGANLVFAAGANRLSNFNDFGSGTRFTNITIAGAGYDISGSAIELDGDLIATFDAGNSTVSLNVKMLGNTTIDVAAGGMLIVEGALTGFGFSVTKDGEGTLRYSGSSANTYASGTLINAGTLVLAKDNNVISSNGSVIVGDNVTAASLVTEGDNQFWVGSTVTVNEGSTFDIGATNQNISVLTLQGASVTIGSGGTLLLFSKLESLATTNDVTSTITGGGSLGQSGSQLLINVADDDDLGVDLSIGVVMTGAYTIHKQSAGTLAVSGENTYDGDLMVSSGVLRVESEGALGSTEGRTIVSSGAALHFSGSSMSFDEDLTIAGQGISSGGVLRVISGETTLNGDILMTAESRLGVADGSALTINGVIDDGVGTYHLRFSAGATGRTTLAGDNTYGGNTYSYGGFLRATHSNAFGDSAATATLSIEGSSTVELTGGISIPSTKTFSAFGGGTDTSAKFMNVSSDNAILGGITLQSSTTIDVTDESTLTIGGVIGPDANSSITKQGNGTLVLEGNSLYQGATTVSAGTLQVDGEISESSGVSLSPGTTLKGSGVVSAITSTGGTVLPGNSPGILSSGGLSLDANSTFAVEIDGTTVGNEYDQLDVTGMVNLGNATLVVSLGFTPTIGSFTIVKNNGNDPVSGTFAGLTEGAQFTVDESTFSISYQGGDGNDVVLTVLSATTTSVVSSNDPSIFGEPVTFTVTVTGAATPTGEVTLFIDGDEVQTKWLNELGVAVFIVNGLLPGNHTVEASYAGEHSFLPSSGALVGGQNVGQSPSTSMIVSSVNPSVFGQAVTFTATVSGLGQSIPTGDVEFFDGGASLGTVALVNGSASITVSNLTTGGHSITAQYLGDASYLPGTSPVLVQGVNHARVSLAITSSSPSSVVGQSLTFSIIASAVSPGAGMPTGLIEVLVDDKPVETVPLNVSGIATVTLAIDQAGAASVGFRYLGDANFSASQQTSTIPVSVAPAGTMTGLIASTNLAVVGQSVTLTAMVSPMAPGAGRPGGQVTFVDGETVLGTAELIDGVATLTVNGLSYGSHTIVAVFNGSDNFDGSTSTALTINVSVVQGDYDGDGIVDLATYEYISELGSGRFNILLSGGGTLTALLGKAGSLPVVGDFDGDGKSDMAVFNTVGESATWTILRSSDGERWEVAFGAANLVDLPAPADYDGDGITDFATFRPNSDLVPGAAQWFILPSNGSSAYSVLFGASNGADMPVPADYDGDGKADIATFRAESDLVPGAAQWFILPSNGSSAYSELFGAGGGIDVPAPADYDGDGKADIATFRSNDGQLNSSAQWFVLPSDGGSATMAELGTPGSIGVPGAYRPGGIADLAVLDRLLALWRIRPLDGSGDDVEEITFGSRGRRVVPVLASLSDRIEAVEDKNEQSTASAIDEFLASINFD